MEGVNLVVGVLGLVASAASLFYAYAAARRSDSLLKRLVVYPFRELDIKFARLSSTEQDVLIRLYRSIATGEKAIDEAAHADLRRSYSDYGPPMLAYLASEGWLVKDSDEQYRLNVDRMPYLTFLIETEAERTKRV